MASDKCWFVLRHTHYPPPTFPENGVGKSEGPICLGHLIPDLKHLDNVINRNGPPEYPPDMPVYATKTRSFNWQSTQAYGVDMSATGGVPIAAVAGMVANGSASLAFQRSTSNFSEFGSLDTFVVQASPAYIEDTLEGKDAIEYVRKHTTLRAWSLFMITGIIVARGGRTVKSESRKKGIGGGPGIELPGIAEAGLDIGASAKNDLAMSSEHVSDFVWAVRLARISKGFLDREWSYETFSRGATYGLEKEENIVTGVVDNLTQDGLKDVELIATSEEVFVLARGGDDTKAVGLHDEPCID